MRAMQEAKSVAREPFAWPGGYPRFLLMTDGGCLCPDCVKREFRLIAQATVKGYRDGWQAAAADINWEDPNLFCDHCGRHIEPAYSDGEG